MHNQVQTSMGVWCSMLWHQRSTLEPRQQTGSTLAKLAELGSVRFRAEVRELQRAVDGSAACANDAELTGLTGHA